MSGSQPDHRGSNPLGGTVFAENLAFGGVFRFAGVGSQLLTWGAWLSREKGLGGRLKLDSSPEFVIWYEKRGLKKLATKPIVFENTEYTPMELTSDAATRLIEAWE